MTPKQQLDAEKAREEAYKHELEGLRVCAEMIQSRMTSLIRRIKNEQNGSGMATICALGEVQGSGGDLDIRCGRIAVYRDLLSGGLG